VGVCLFGGWVVRQVQGKPNWQCAISEGITCRQGPGVMPDGDPVMGPDMRVSIAQRPEITGWLEVLYL